MLKEMFGQFNTLELVGIFAIAIFSIIAAYGFYTFTWLLVH